MKFAVSFIAPVVALRVADVHPTVNMVLTNDGAMDANAFSFAQSKSKSLKAELKDFVKFETSHASLMEGDFHQPNVIRINYDSPHAALLLRASYRSDLKQGDSLVPVDGVTISL